MSYPQIEKLKEFSVSKLKNIRFELDENLSNSEYKDKITVITTGSYGRHEASEESDMDWFVIFDADLPARDTIEKELKAVSSVVDNNILKAAGSTGTFGNDDAILKYSNMLINIGGHQDSNISLTRRMLFLLEGTWLYGENRFVNYQKKLLQKYIKEGTPESSVNRFLLNDIIRYYRTITTDFEHKVSEAGKSWGLRNIKLRFSRKLLYFGGVLVVSELVGKDRGLRIESAEKLFKMPVIERIAKIGSDNEKTKDILKIYDTFLEKISDNESRNELDSVVREERFASPVYKELRALSIDFSHILAKWLEIQYHDDHSIHHSLIF
jgi:predicted nucleotidyltransferase